MLGRTMLAAIALATTALTVPVALPDAQAVPEPPPSVLSTGDSGKTVDVAVGTSVTVKLEVLEQDGLRFAWGAPVSSDPTVLQEKEGESASFAFAAVAAGVSDLVAEGTCEPVDEGAVCPEAVDPWKVTVNVAAPGA